MLTLTCNWMNRNVAILNFIQNIFIFHDIALLVAYAYLKTSSKRTDGLNHHLHVR